MNIEMKEGWLVKVGINGIRGDDWEFHEFKPDHPDEVWDHKIRDWTGLYVVKHIMYLEVA